MHALACLGMLAQAGTRPPMLAHALARSREPSHPCTCSCTLVHARGCAFTRTHACTRPHTSSPGPNLLRRLFPPAPVLGPSGRPRIRRRWPGTGDPFGDTGPEGPWEFGALSQPRVPAPALVNGAGAGGCQEAPLSGAAPAGNQWREVDEVSPSPTPPRRHPPAPAAPTAPTRTCGHPGTRQQHGHPTVSVSPTSTHQYLSASLARLSPMGTQWYPSAPPAPTSTMGTHRYPSSPPAPTSPRGNLRHPSAPPAPTNNDQHPSAPWAPTSPHHSHQCTPAPTNTHQYPSAPPASVSPTETRWPQGTHWPPPAPWKPRAPVHPTDTH